MLFIFSCCGNVWLGKQLSGVQTTPQRRGEQTCTLVLFVHMLFSHKGPGGRVHKIPETRIQTREASLTPETDIRDFFSSLNIENV